MTPDSLVDDAPEECPECGSKNLALDTRRAELVCMKCFLVVAEVLSIPGTETEVENDIRVRSSDEDRLLPQYKFSNKDAAGKPVKHDLLWKYRRVAREYNLRPPERTMLSMESRIRRFGAAVGVPHGIVERAVNLYRLCKDKNVFKKPSLDEWALALLLTACREVGYVVPVGDLAAEGRDAWKILSYHHRVARDLGVRARLPGVEAYVVYFAGRLGVAPDSPVVRHALALSKLVADPNATPNCVAIASLYIATQDAGMRVQQKVFCAVAHITEISLRIWASKLGGYARDEKSVVPEFDKSEILEDLGGPEEDDEREGGE